MAGLTFGAAYIGLNMVINLMISTVNPMIEIMIEEWGLKNDILDVGWAVGSAIAYSTTCGALIILVSLGVNILMLATKLTKTLNVDIWNFWNHAFTATVVYLISGNLIIGLIAGAIHAAFCLVMADQDSKTGTRLLPGSWCFYSPRLGSHKYSDHCRGELGIRPDSGYQRYQLG